jgi:3-keto-5-aminohexanoate cleavage enzyme
MKGVVITAALNGALVQRSRVETVPVEPAEIAAEAQLAAEAGAAVVHVHARESGGALSYRVERYRETLMEIRQRTDALVSMTTLMPGVGLEQRLAVVDARPDIVWLPLGTNTPARFDARGGVFEGDHPFIARFSDTVRLAERALQLGVKPWLVYHDLGHVSAARALIESGMISVSSPAVFRLGLLNGIDATAHNMCRLHEALPTNGGFTLADGNWALRAAALASGGNIRVGFEEGTALPGGETATDNAALVRAAARLATAMGREICSSDDLRS